MVGLLSLSVELFIGLGKFLALSSDIASLPHTVLWNSENIYIMLKLDCMSHVFHTLIFFLYFFPSLLHFEYFVLLLFYFAVVYSKYLVKFCMLSVLFLFLLIFLNTLIIVFLTFHFEILWCPKHCKIIVTMLTSQISASYVAIIRLLKSGN